MARRTIAVIATLFALTGTACADAASTDPGTGSPSDDPGAASELLFRVSYEGGFTPVEYHLTNLPAFSLYADGTILTPGAQIEIYPPPALPAIQSQTVDEAGIDAILTAATDAGLGTTDDLTDMGSVMIADAPDTVFTLHTDDVDTTVRVYALMGLQERPPSMSVAEFDARVALQELVEDLGRLGSWLPDGSLQGEAEPYVAQGSRVFVGDVRNEPDLAQEPIAWPLEPALASFGERTQTTGYRCGVVAGGDWTQTLAPLASQANQLTPWTSEGHRSSLLFRPLLPDEAAC